MVNREEAERFMRRALELAELGSGRVNPNPLVGAVVVRQGSIVAEAYHRAYGGAHAEALALRQAGSAAQGAELYVNLEPCVAFPGKQTPPCTEQIIASGIARVIIAARDPNPQVSGRGVERLRAAGIEVHEGLLVQEADRLNEIHRKYATTGHPFVLLKLALSADGKIATSSGDSRWISSKISRQEVHRLRDRYAAVLVGLGTVLQDDPRLTVRLSQGRDPLRIVLDSQGRIPLDAKILHLNSSAKTIIVTTDALPTGKAARLSSLAAEVWRLPAAEPGRVNLRSLLQKLAEQRIDSLLVEGGSTVAGSFFAAELVDKVLFFIAPLIVGGHQAPGAIGGAGFTQIAAAVRLKGFSVGPSGPDFALQGYPEYDQEKGEKEEVKRK